MLDENEFLSPYGIRSLSRIHREQPYVFHLDGQEYRVDYEPGGATTGFFGGNSNWRGPVWFPVNYLLIEALERYHHFYGDGLRVECPTGSGHLLNLQEVADELRCRLSRLFLPDAQGRRPCHGEERRYAEDPHWRDLVLFHEYFHGETGRGLGASHQTGWTALARSDVAPATERSAATPRTRTGATWCCSTNTSTGRRVADWAPAIRRAGLPWPDRTSPLPRRGAPLRRGPALARPGVVPRILPRGDGSRTGRQPSDGLDCPGRSAPAAPRWSTTIIPFLGDNYYLPRIQ